MRGGKILKAGYVFANRDNKTEHRDSKKSQQSAIEYGDKEVEIGYTKKDRVWN